MNCFSVFCLIVRIGETRASKTSAKGGATEKAQEPLVWKCTPGWNWTFCL